MTLTDAAGASRTVPAKLVSPLPEGTLPDRIRLEYEMGPVSAEVSDPRLRFQLEIGAKRHQGASSAGGTRSHEIRLLD